MTNLVFKKYNPIDYTIEFINMYPNFTIFKAQLDDFIDFHTLDNSFEKYYNRMVNIWRNYLLVYPTDDRNNLAVAKYVNQILGVVKSRQVLATKMEDLGNISTHLVGDNQNANLYIETKDKNIDTMKVLSYLKEQDEVLSNQINDIIRSMKVIFVSFPKESINQVR